jgi:hypothetical protein
LQQQLAVYKRTIGRSSRTISFPSTLIRESLRDQRMVGVSAERVGGPDVRRLTVGIAHDRSGPLDALLRRQRGNSR